MFAPSAGNEQPWQFIIIKNKTLLKQIPRIHEHAQMINDATAGILVCYDLDLEKHYSMAVQDCSAATENILLAIHDLGLGGCWLGVYPRKKRMDGLRNLFKLPEHIIPFSLVSIGIPDEQKENINRYNKDRLHHENIPVFDRSGIVFGRTGIPAGPLQDHKSGLLRQSLKRNTASIFRLTDHNCPLFHQAQHCGILPRTGRDAGPTQEIYLLTPGTLRRVTISL